MLARCSPLFELAPTALMVVTYVGAITAFFAATIGLVQNDIKRVIAYSTCSQLGYMFFACGVSAYNAAVFHLFTHGFFKALLFLGAGSVIHAVSGEQDMRRMGGLWKKIPYTYAFMWIGSLALAGIPLFAGFFSKDGILEAAYAAGTTQGMVAYILGISAAFMTAFYSWRLLFMTFHGTPRASEEVMHHVHESPPIMLVPLVPLVLGAMFAGAIGYYVWGILDPSLHFWNGAITILNAHHEEEHAPFLIEHLPLIAGISGITLAYIFYIRRPEYPTLVKMRFAGLYKFLLNKWYFDELYDWLFVRRAIQLGQWLWRFFDTRIIDGLGPNGAAFLTRGVARESGARADRLSLSLCLRDDRRASRSHQLAGLHGDSLMDHILTSLIILPLIAAVVTYFASRCETTGSIPARWIALISTILIFLFSLTLLVGFDEKSAAFQFVEKATWFKGYNIDYKVGIDGISLWLILLTTFLMPICVACSWRLTYGRIALTKSAW